jgi:hypothetical protein
VKVNEQERNCWRVKNSGAEAAVYFVAFNKENLKLFAAAYGM